MGIYYCEKADADAIVLRHEGPDDHTIEVHAGIAGAAASGPFAPVPGYILSQVAPGKRYSSNGIFFAEYGPYVTPPSDEQAPAQAQPAQEAAEDAQADAGSDQPSDAASAVSEPSSPDAGGQPAEPDSEA